MEFSSSPGSRALVSGSPGPAGRAAGVRGGLPADRGSGIWPLAVERTERLRAEVAAFEGLLENLVVALEARVPGALQHGARVARIADAIGRRLGLSAESLNRMRRGAILHDIGKLVLPDRLLSRAARLDPGELDAVQAHPVIGYALLRGVPYLEPILPFVHRHHERVDGSGFPDGLSGAEIPMTVQVVSIADAYDETAARSPTRPHFARARALATLAEETRLGRWDPSLLGLLELATGGRKGALPAGRRRASDARSGLRPAARP